MSLSEKRHAGGFILSERDGHGSRENGTLKAGNLEAGTILGAVLSAAAAAAVGSPTGNGVITIGTVFGSQARPGIYTLACVAAASNAGTFNLYAPDGTLVRQITVGGGATDSPHFRVTIADGATDFVVGDSWTVTVSNSGYKQVAPAATDGTQVASAILIGGADATSADQLIALFVRDGEVNGNELVYSSGATNAQKAMQAQQLAANGISIR